MEASIRSITTPNVCQTSPYGTTACQPREELLFHSVPEALGRVQSVLAADPILAFGYTHREDQSHRSAVEFFAVKVIPWLAAQGYNDLVLEILPHGSPGDRLEREIAEFNRQGTIGPEMTRFINVIDRINFESLLRVARQHGISIHSGGVSYEHVSRTILHPEFPLALARQELASREIRDNSHSVVRSLARAGRRVASFNGCQHNDVRPFPRNAPFGFGASLSRLFPRRYAEIDIVMPELSRRNNYFTDLPLSSACCWESFINNSGVNLVSERTPNSYIIFLPEQ